MSYIYTTYDKPALNLSQDYKGFHKDASNPSFSKDLSDLSEKYSKLSRNKITLEIKLDFVDKIFNKLDKKPDPLKEYQLYNIYKLRSLKDPLLDFVFAFAGMSRSTSSLGDRYKRYHGDNISPELLTKIEKIETQCLNFETKIDDDKAKLDAKIQLLASNHILIAESLRDLDEAVSKSFQAGSDDSGPDNCRYSFDEIIYPILKAWEQADAQRKLLEKEQQLKKAQEQEELNMLLKKAEKQAELQKTKQQAQSQQVYYSYNTM